VLPEISPLGLIHLACWAMLWWALLWDFTLLYRMWSCDHICGSTSWHLPPTCPADDCPCIKFRMVYNGSRR